MDQQNEIFRRIRGDELGDRSMWTDDWATSAQGLGSVVQRGQYTLSTGKAFVPFPRQYSNMANNVVLLLTSRTATMSYVESSAISGFTVSGSGSDTGYWLACGYK